MIGDTGAIFKLQTSDGAVAVKSFLQPVTGQKARYTALAESLHAHPLPGILQPHYLVEGVRVGENWFPLVIMPWVEGLQLHQYIEQHLRDSDRISALAEGWVKLMQSLDERQIIHGDLEHTNILVESHGSITLVDYDTVAVPSLTERHSLELGHPNYQHPLRGEIQTLQEQGDRFAALVVYVSFLALRLDPTMWTFHNGENLILKADDFLSPGRTPIWGRLKGLPDTIVRRLTAELEAACRAPFEATLPLGEILQRVSRGQAGIIVPSGIPATTISRPAPSPPTTPRPEPAAPVPTSDVPSSKAGPVAAAAVPPVHPLKDPMSSPVSETPAALPVASPVTETATEPVGQSKPQDYTAETSTNIPQQVSPAVVTSPPQQAGTAPTPSQDKTTAMANSGRWVSLAGATIILVCSTCVLLPMTRPFWWINPIFSIAFLSLVPGGITVLVGAVLSSVALARKNTHNTTRGSRHALIGLLVGIGSIVLFCPLFFAMIYLASLNPAPTTP